MLNTIELYREFVGFHECCEKGYPLVTDWVPYGSTNVPMYSLSDIPCNCEFGEIRKVMEEIETHFEIDETWDNEKREIKLFHVALLIMDLKNEL